MEWDYEKDGSCRVDFTGWTQKQIAKWCNDDDDIGQSAEIIYVDFKAKKRIYNNQTK